VLIAGFFIAGSGVEQVLVRGIGPALEAFGVSGTIASPATQRVRRGWKRSRGNEGWSTDPRAAQNRRDSRSRGRISASDRGSADCSVLPGSTPGGYTAQVSGVSARPATEWWRYMKCRRRTADEARCPSAGKLAPSGSHFFFAATLTRAQDFPPGQATAPDTGRGVHGRTFVVRFRPKLPALPTAAEACPWPMSTSAKACEFHASKLNIAPWVSRSSEGIFYAEIGSNNFRVAVDGRHRRLQRRLCCQREQRHPSRGGWSWSKPFQNIAPGTQFRAFGYCTCYNKAGAAGRVRPVFMDGPGDGPGAGADDSADLGQRHHHLRPGLGAHCLGWRGNGSLRLLRDWADEFCRNFHAMDAARRGARTRSMSASFPMNERRQCDRSDSRRMEVNSTPYVSR